MTLKGPGGFIQIDAGGVSIVGTLVLINVSGSPGSAPDAKPAAPEDPTEAKVQPPNAPPPPLTITSVTDATSPANRARTALGVGEVVTLTVSPGPATWAITTGGGTLSPGGSQTNVTFTAGENAESVVITATSGASSGMIQFNVMQQDLSNSATPHFTLEIYGNKYAFAREIRSRNRSLGEASRWLDPPLSGALTLEAFRVENSKAAPQKEPVVAGFSVRPSRLNQRLFASLGELGPLLTFILEISAIVFILIYNGTTDHAIDFAVSYRYVGLPVGLLVLVLALSYLGTLWFKRILRRS